MKLYWACGRYIDSNGKIDRLFTYNASTSEAKARGVIRCWAVDYGFNITKAWIDVYQNGKKIEVIPVALEDCLV